MRYLQLCKMNFLCKAAFSGCAGKLAIKIVVLYNLKKRIPVYNMRNLEVCELSRTIFEERCTNASHIVHRHDLMYMIKNAQLTICDNYGNELHTVLPNLSWTTQLTILEFENRLWFGTGTQFIHASLLNYSIKYIDPEFTFEAAVWNPAQDSIAVVSSTGTVGVYTVDFEEGRLVSVQESHLNNEVVTDFINVGWGSAPTQFLGDGKVADLVEEEAKPMVIVDDQRPRISWRGNGDMFAVNYFKGGKRQFKVFKNPCELIYQSEDIVGLQPLIAWRPQGNKIACVVWTKKVCRLILFEKNGLLRDSFNLPKMEKVADVKWSPCGVVLAVCQAYDEKHMIYLFVQRNQIWYLKQTLDFPISLISFEFIPSPSTTIGIQCTQADETEIYSFKYTVHCSTSDSFHTAVSSAVIYGKEIRVTFCKAGMIPPPRFDVKAEAPAPINFVMFHPTQQRLAIVDVTNKLMMFDIKDTKLAFTGHYTFISEANIPLALHHFIWSDDDEIICVAENVDGGNDTKKYILDVHNSDCNKWVFHVEEGPPVQYSCTELLINKHGLHTKLMQLIPAATLYVKLVKAHENLYVFSLTSAGKFYINDKETLEGVTSFIVHDKYLFLTNTQNKLMVVRLKEEALEAFCRTDFSNVFFRPVEPGSFLLFGIPETFSVAMQIPRGNVETCTCQLVSIDRIEAFIQQNQWKEAMELIRIEKLATSILVDLDITRFVNNVDQFIISVEAPQILMDFLFGLEKNNVFLTLYQKCGSGTPINIDNKLEMVCNAMIDYMEANNYNYYVACVVAACFVKDSPTSVQKALEHVQKLLCLAETEPTVMAVAEHALKSVFTLKQSAEIYKAALLMYDLNLALFVARNSNMDPKEYEPFIDALHRMDKVKLRYQVNHYFKNYGQAVRYLVRCFDDIEDLTKYVEDYGVYNDAYWASDSEPVVYEEVSKIYAKHLVGRSLYKEAALMFLAVSEFSSAFENFKKANEWQETIDLMKHLNFSQEESHQHFRDLANDLINSDRVVEASEIYDKYLSDHESAIHLLIEHKLFYEASKLVRKYHRNDIFESDIRDALLDYCDTLKDKFTKMQKTFIEYKGRLHEIRIRKLAKKKTSATASQDQQFQTEPNFEDDVVSVTGSSSTYSTRSSRTLSSHSSTSSSSRRKEERKMLDLRPGGFYEDIALMRALYDLIHEAFAMGPEIRQLCYIGMKLHEIGLSPWKKLQNSLLKLQTIMQESIKTIWQPNMNNPQDGDHDLVLDNIPFLDMKYRAPPSNLDTTWTLLVLCDALNKYPN